MNHKIYILPILFMILGACSSTSQKYYIKEDGTIHVPAYTLPESSFLSDESKTIIKKKREEYKKLFKEQSLVCPYPSNPNEEQIRVHEECNRQYFYTTSLYRNTLARYDVNIEIDTINGVYTEVFTPSEGIKEANRDRVLISLHSGAFLYGSRTDSRMESIPIASVGGIKVISIDYRMGPKHQFPAASEDVTAVYKGLLKDYKPENIGIYGYAAGGALTTQSLAWFQKENLPLPGAVGIICMAAAEPRPKTDSMYMVSATLGHDGIAPFTVFEPYYGKNPDFENPLLVPLKSKEILSNFPPSLLIASTRDFHLSSVVYTHSQLIKLGVEAELHVWEGLGHVFLANSELTESRDAYQVIVNFFNKYLN
ncbi:alpha/beta hydrolase [Flavivirga spongiicola]|uniref:Alpha/beta hydrolase n=1 Tax=Flavivirga spongiicola TaxID=421621 RepID=A0ABU7XXT4_9FLAO|nr:alpha/beta hydrolase [Flavivirga sp. MEBiC05379]MDO5980603.1 alpha/beta hydrolase [Flavivirga sp. MEBiC05379]